MTPEEINDVLENFDVHAKTVQGHTLVYEALIGEYVKFYEAQDDEAEVRDE